MNGHRCTGMASCRYYSSALLAFCKIVDMVALLPYTNHKLSCQYTVAFPIYDVINSYRLIVFLEKSCTK